MRTWPTTCTACRAPFDAGYFVVSDQETRLCPECEGRVENDRLSIKLLCDLVDANAEVRRVKERIAAHKASHPTLVVTGQGEYRKEYG